MSTLNRPRGNFLFKDLPTMELGAGVKTPWATLLPPTANVAAYLRSTGTADGDTKAIKERLVKTLDQALQACRDNKGDTVYVLPGHTENVADATMLDNVAPGTRIIGVGSPLEASAPVFRWTATGGQWTVDQADLLFQGLKLRLEGANGVTKAINITAAGCSFIGCDIEVASGASNKATIAMEIGSAALSTSIIGNNFRGTATHNTTDGIKLVGATVPSKTKILDNTMIFSSHATNGMIHVTVAALDLLIANNYMYNHHTSSQACIKIDNIAADGLIANNMMAVKNSAGSALTQGIQFAGTTNPLMVCLENYCVDTKQKSGMLSPAASS